MSSLLFVAAPFLIGALLGALTRFRIVSLSLPPLVVALVYWISFGWFGDDYDIGRAVLIIFTGVLGGGVVACWVAGCGVGRLVRRNLMAR